MEVYNMELTEMAKEIVTLLKNKNIKILEYFCRENNDERTNTVRNELTKQNVEEIKIIKEFLESLMNACYDNKLMSDLNSIKLSGLDDSQLFLLKENIIYYFGRLSELSNLELLKKAFYIDDDKHIKLNIAFASLSTFDEEIELDFISKLINNSDYDLMLRSWTISFFVRIDNPYDYVDNGNDDWTKAKMARIKRLMINSEENPKFIKAMSFRLMDLIVIYLFLKNRSSYKLTEEEQSIIKKYIL